MQSPGYLKASRPSTALSPLAGPRADGGMRIFSTFIIDRRRELAFRAFDSRPVSCQGSQALSHSPGDEKCLVQTWPAILSVSFLRQRTFICVGGLSSRRSLQFTAPFKRHWTCEELLIRSVV